MLVISAARCSRVKVEEVVVEALALDLALAPNPWGYELCEEFRTGLTVGGRTVFSEHGDGNGDERDDSMHAHTSFSAPKALCKPASRVPIPSCLHVRARIWLFLKLWKKCLK